MTAVASHAAYPREQTSVCAIAAGESTDRALHIFSEVPPRHGVIAAVHDSSIIRRGEVAVYAEGSVDTEGLIEGEIYAVEYQAPANSMPAHLFATLPGARMDVTRSLVTLRKHDTTRQLWWLHPLREAAGRAFVTSDGPYSDSVLAPKLLGRVVGIYNPAALAQVSL